ncbi:MAG: hypothetical protein KF832_13460 [Caldilineaceae bacterium]|nr:hypothetical protein [Caldilineaceae bacterium]
MNSTLILFEAHSGWRYLVLLIVGVALLKFLVGLLAKQQWSRFDQILGMATPIVIDIQLLLGIVLWITQQRWSGGDTLVSWEHPVIMLVALIGAHVAWSRTKRATTAADKFRTAFLGFLIAGLLIALGVARITRVI